MKKYTYLPLAIALLLSACKTEDFELVSPPSHQTEVAQTAAEILTRLHDADGTDVLVVAHRAAWQNAPENSISAIKNAIELGVDMVEIDVRKTKDGELVLMHDETIDRMTAGTGRVDSYTLEELKSFPLRNRNGGVMTTERIPTLREAAEAARDKILLRIDKSYDYLDEVVRVLSTTNTLDQAAMIVPQTIMPGNVDFNYPGMMDSVMFIPTINADGASGMTQLSDYQQYKGVVGFETSFADEGQLMVNFHEIRTGGDRVMVYTGSSGSAGGRDDEMAKSNTDLVYGWLIDQGVNMIQTDEPELLLQYLRLNQLHN